MKYHTQGELRRLTNGGRCWGNKGKEPGCIPEDYQGCYGARLQQAQGSGLTSKNIGSNLDKEKDRESKPYERSWRSLMKKRWGGGLKKKNESEACTGGERIERVTLSP